MFNRHKYMVTYLRERRRRLVEKGLCGECGKFPIAPRHISCERCLARKRTNARIKDKKPSDLNPIRLKGPCDICGREGQHVDHDHLTGMHRGLLCRTCNVGLGYFRDDPRILRRASAYLLRVKRKVRKGKRRL